jgi:hypothetical protein
MFCTPDAQQPRAAPLKARGLRRAVTTRGVAYARGADPFRYSVVSFLLRCRYLRCLKCKVTVVFARYSHGMCDMVLWDVPGHDSTVF